MEFKKQLFIFSKVKLNDIKTIFSNSNVHELEASIKKYHDLNNDLNDVIDIHEHFYEFGLMKFEKFPYIYVFSEHSTSVLNKIKKLGLNLMVIEIKSLQHSKNLYFFLHELRSGYDLLSSISLAWSESGFSHNFKSVKVNNYLDCCSQSLDDAKDYLRKIANEFYKVYKNEYQPYSNLAMEPNYE
jgi:hypothetical protein